MVEIKKDKINSNPPILPQLTGRALEDYLARLAILNQIALNHGAVSVTAQVAPDGKIVSVRVPSEEKK